jgi:hypothetical protein
MHKALFALAAFLMAASVKAGDPPHFASDLAADQWLREASPYYRRMAGQIETRASYSFRGSDELSGGIVRWESGKLIIELSNSLSGAKRLSILIFEITNAFQDAQHREIDANVTAGRVATPREFGILHELVELDGLRHHRLVLQELDRKLQGIPPGILQWINPELQKLGDYELPYAFEYIKAQESGGHTKHYHEWFYRQVPPPPRPAAN